MIIRIFLTVIIILLILVLLILFVPLKYRISGVFNDEKRFADFKLTHLFGLAGLIIKFNRDYSIKGNVKIAGISAYQINGKIGLPEKKAEDDAKTDNKLKSFLNEHISDGKYKNVKTECIRILKKIKPKKGRIQILYGSDDPMKTAKVMQRFALLYAFIGDIMDVTPSFERKVTDVNAEISGDISIISLIMSWIRLNGSNAFKELLQQLLENIKQSVSIKLK